MGDGPQTPADSGSGEFTGKTSPTVTENPDSGIYATPDASGPSSQSQSTGAFVTRGDSVELDAYSDAYDNTLDVESDAPTPGEFARQAFTTGAQARRVNAGFDGHAATINESDELVGGWNSFSMDDVDNRVELGDVPDAAEGANSDSISVVELEQSPDRATERAYVSEYTEERTGYDIEHAHAEMSTYAALDSMGVRVPRHTLDTDSKHVFTEDISRDGYDGAIADAETLPSEYADRVDPEQFEDMMAANMIVGNYDLKAENVFVGEDGNVTTFDFDQVFGAEDLEQFHDRLAKNGIQTTIDNINAARSDAAGELDTSTEAVADRARELATQLDESGVGERVMAVASEYDEFFESEDASEYGVSENIRSAEERVRKHIEGWSDA